ncbi:MAG: YraN family protein [Verrucomicrobiota bacterium]|nr:YraN family protein [Verrucomicrobiota bacterium]
MHSIIQYFRTLWQRVGKRKELPLRARRGKIAEDAAARYLSKEKGMRILLRNWRTGKYELDLICEDRGQLVFVEVRARSADAIVSGYHSLTVRKRRALRKGCIRYLRSVHPRPKFYRFDVVEIELQGDSISALRHFENVALF